MSNLRYVVLTDYIGPNIRKALVRTVDGQWYRAEHIVKGKRNISLGFPVEDATALLELRLNNKFYLDATSLGPKMNNTIAYKEQAIREKEDSMLAIALVLFVGFLVFFWFYLSGAFDYRRLVNLNSSIKKSQTELFSLAFQIGKDQQFATPFPKHWIGQQ